MRSFPRLTAFSIEFNNFEQMIGARTPGRLSFVLREARAYFDAARRRISAAIVFTLSLSVAFFASARALD